MAQFNPYAQYQEMSFSTQTPEALVVTTYDAIIRALKDAGRAITDNDFQSRTRQFDLAFELISELRKSLNHDAGGDFATKLESLYVYFTREILVANATSDPTRLKPVIANLETIRDAWVQAKSQLSA